MPTIALTFLTPFAGILAAAIAAPTLLALYFLKLRRRPLRVSSTMFWSRATADLQVNAPFRWLRFSWLLILQLVALAAFCLALARPALDLHAASANTLAILIDQSASMGAIDQSPTGIAVDEPQSRLARARDAAIDEVNTMPSGARAMVVALGARPEVLTGLTGDRALLRRAIESIEPTDAPADLHAALAVASAALAVTENEPGAAPPQITLYSDGAFDPRLTAQSRVVAPLGRAKLQFVRIGPEQSAPRDNAGIVALAARRDYDDPALIRVFVRVQSTTTDPIDVGLACMLDGAPIASTRLRVSGATAEALGAGAHTFEFTAPEGGLVTTSLVRTDAMATDNTAAVVLKKPQPLSILLVQPNVPSDLLDYLPADALAALGPGSLRILTLGEYESLAPTEIAASSLVVFDRSRPSALPPIPSISFGAAIPIPGTSMQPYAPDDPDGAPTTFAFWVRTHPVMRFVSLAGVSVLRPLRLSIPAPSAQGPAITATILASGPAGPLVALLESAGLRRLVVGFELADSRWWQDASFPVFLKNAVDHLTLSGDESAGASYRPSEPVTVRPAPRATQVTLSGPTTLRRSVSGESAARITLGSLPLAGVYQAEGVAPEDEVIAVNMLDPFESAIATRNEVIIAGEAIAAQLSGSVGPQEIWPWLVLAALVMLCAEWVLYARRMRV